MKKFHALLRRQWQRIFGRDRAMPEEWRAFMQTVSDTYDEFDTGRLIVERALALSSEELHSANAELRGVLQSLPDPLFRVCADDRICGSPLCPAMVLPRGNSGAPCSRFGTLTPRCHSNTPTVLRIRRRSTKCGCSLSSGSTSSGSSATSLSANTRRRRCGKARNAQPLRNGWGTWGSSIGTC